MTRTNNNILANDNDAGAIALSAIAWILADDDRAQRFLALTGLSPETLRAQIMDPALQGAALAFLEGHEPDLIACAQAQGCDPAALTAAARTLGVAGHGA